MLKSIREVEQSRTQRARLVPLTRALWSHDDQPPLTTVQPLEHWSDCLNRITRVTERKLRHERRLETPDGARIDSADSRYCNSSLPGESPHPPPAEGHFSSATVSTLTPLRASNAGKMIL